MEATHGMNDSIVAQSRRALDDAIQLYVNVMYPDSGVLVDWTVLAETVDPNLDEEFDAHALYMLNSPQLSSWKLYGMTHALTRLVVATI